MKLIQKIDSVLNALSWIAPIAGAIYIAIHIGAALAKALLSL